jgi:hypothetical protein
LGHPGKAALQHLAQSSSIICSKSEDDSLFHACQLGQHVRLPFTSSLPRATKNFDLIHCDLWTYPIVSVSGFKYYLVIIDDYSHFLWTFPLPLKFDAFPTISNFSPMCPLNLVALSSQFNVTMVGNLIIPLPALSFLPKVYPYACLAHTPHSKTGKPSA